MDAGHAVAHVWGLVDRRSQIASSIMPHGPRNGDQGVRLGEGLLHLPSHVDTGFLFIY